MTQSDILQYLEWHSALSKEQLAEVATMLYALETEYRFQLAEAALEANQWKQNYFQSLQQTPSARNRG